MGDVLVEINQQPTNYILMFPQFIMNRLSASVSEIPGDELKGLIN